MFVSFPKILETDGGYLLIFEDLMEWNVKEITDQWFLESGILILSLEIGLESQYLTFYKGWELWVFGFSVCAQQIAIKTFE